MKLSYNILELKRKLCHTTDLCRLVLTTFHLINRSRLVRFKTDDEWWWSIVYEHFPIVTQSLFTFPMSCTLNCIHRNQSPQLPPLSTSPYLSKSEYSNLYDIRINTNVHACHPFLSFYLSCSEGRFVWLQVEFSKWWSLNPCIIFRIESSSFIHVEISLVDPTNPN